MYHIEDRLGTYFAFVCAVFFLIIIFGGGPRVESSVSEYVGKEYIENSFLELVDRTYGKSRLLSRIRRVARKDNHVLSYAYLKLPKQLTRRTMDTSKWEVDVSIKPLGSQGLIVDEIFASGTLSLAQKSNAHVLILGLGGGFLSSYLHHAFPQMSITAVEPHRPTFEMAKKWFSLTPDKLFRVVVEDGIQYLKQSIRTGRQFDFIILDACFIETDHDIHCPSKTFLDETVVDYMAKLIREQGALIVNVLPNSNYPAQLIEKVKAALRKSFNYHTVRVQHVEGTSNYILTFTQFDYKGLYNEFSNIPDSSK
nr:GF15348 [Haemonchus contortus]